MTIASEVCEVLYAGDSVTKDFSFPFRTQGEYIFGSLVDDVTGAETPITSNYLISLNPVGAALWAEGGSYRYPVTGTAVAPGTHIKVYRKPPDTQTTSLRSQGVYLPEEVEKALDRAAMRDQDLQRQVNPLSAGLAGLNAAVASATASASASASSAAAAAASAASIFGPIIAFAVKATQNAPAVGPAVNDFYLVGTAGSGLWAGHSNSITKWDGANWLFAPPAEGWTVWDQGADLSYRYDGAAWVSVATGAMNVVQNRTALAALTGANRTAAMIWNEGGRNGEFRWSSSNNSANVTADPGQGIYVPPASDTTGASGCWVRVAADSSKRYNAKWFGAVGDGSTDDTTAIQRTINMGVGVTCYLPAGTYKVTSTLLIDKSDQSLRGDGDEATLILTNQATGNVIFIGNSSVLCEQQNLSDLQIGSSVDRTSGAHVLLDWCNTVHIENVRMKQCYTGIQMGGATFFKCALPILTNVYISTHQDGIVMTSPSGVRLNQVDISGYLLATPSSPSPGYGIRITDGADGVWMSDTCTISQFNRGFFITTSNASCASIFVRGGIGGCTVAGISVNTSGTASLNGLYIENCQISGNGGAFNSDVGFIVEGVGSGGHNVHIAACQFDFIGQRVIHTAAALTSLVITGCMMRGCGGQNPNTFTAIDLGSVANGNVLVSGVYVNGQHNYGLANVHASTNISIGTSFLYGSAGQINNFGTAGSNRKYRGIIAIADAG